MATTTNADRKREQIARNITTQMAKLAEAIMDAYKTEKEWIGSSKGNQTKRYLYEINKVYSNSYLKGYHTKL